MIVILLVWKSLFSLSVLDGAGCTRRPWTAAAKASGPCPTTLCRASLASGSSHSSKEEKNVEILSLIGDNELEEVKITECLHEVFGYE